MLVLRLVRTGRRNQPKYRLVAAEQGEKLDGKVVEILGHYEPAAKSKLFVFDKEKVQGWLAKGGVPSNTVAKLLNMNGFDLPVHLRAEGKPKKKAQAKIDAANKPSSDAKAMGDVPVEAPKPAEPVSAEEATPSEPEGVVEASAVAEAMVDQASVEAVAEETASVVEKIVSSSTEVEADKPVAEEVPSVAEAMVDQVPAEEVSEENKEV